MNVLNCCLIRLAVVVTFSKENSEEEEDEDESVGNPSNFYASSSDEEIQANELATFLALGVSNNR